MPKRARDYSRLCGQALMGISGNKKGMARKGFHSLPRVAIHKSVPGIRKHATGTKKCQKTAMPMHGILWHYLQS